MIIEKHLNGDIKINLKERYLNYTILPERPKKEIDVKLPALTITKQSDWKPPANHPWRRQLFFNKLKIKQKNKQQNLIQKNN